MTLFVSNIYASLFKYPPDDIAEILMLLVECVIEKYLLRKYCVIIVSFDL